jgi:hypothetical protein
MKKKLPEKYQRLKIGDKLKINGETYAIKGRIIHKIPNELGWKREIIIYNLDNGLSLEYDWSWSFSRLETKKGFPGFTTTKSNYIPIKNISIIK